MDTLPPPPMDDAWEPADFADRPTMMPLEIATAMMKVCRAVTTIGYDGENTHSNYKFASIDAFLGKVGSMCADAGLMILPEEILARRTTMMRDNRPVELLQATYRFWLVHESGVMWSHPMTRRIELRWDGPQSYGSAESYVLKRFFRALFKIPTGDALDPASDMADPDLRRGGTEAPARAGRNDPTDPLFGGATPPPPGFTSASEKPRRNAPPPTSAPPENTVLPPINGDPPYRVFNGLGEPQSEFTDLKAWGLAMKKHLTAFPASAPANRSEVKRLRDFFLNDPDLPPRSRKTLETAFDSLEPLLDPPPPAGAPVDPPPGDPPHDPVTGEILPSDPPADAAGEEPDPYAGRIGPE